MAVMFMAADCENVKPDPISRSGVAIASTTVQLDVNGKTIEQNNVIQRLKEDNKPGAIKHLYIISAYSGQVLIYSTVKGKVTSSGKRLSPTTLARSGGQSDYAWYNTDLIQDDGTFGSSIEYLYWWDSKGIYHQQYVTGGMILHISNQPLAVKSVTLNMEL
jgi:hypothetical protein